MILQLVFTIALKSKLHTLTQCDVNKQRLLLESLLKRICAEYQPSVAALSGFGFALAKFSSCLIGSEISCRVFLPIKTNTLVPLEASLIAKT